MLRVVIVLSAAFYLAVGAALYFLPSQGIQGFSVTPLWVARIAGAVLLGWGILLGASARQPSGATVAGVAAANLLVAATLVPATLAGDLRFGTVPLILPVLLSGVLVFLGILALLLPRDAARHDERSA